MLGKNVRGIAARWITPLGAVAVLAILVLGIGSASAGPSTGPAPAPTTLLTISEADAVAANTSTVFAQGVMNCTQIWAVAPWGGAGVYANLPSNAHCTEGSLAIALETSCQTVNLSAREGPAAGSCCNCEQDVLYDIVGGVLYRITDWGTNVTVVATFPDPYGDGQNWGLTWDSVGTFNYDLIVTRSTGGAIWTVDPLTNVVTPFKTLGKTIMGPTVAPMSFGSWGGDLLVAEKHLNQVVAITPGGVVSVVTSWARSNGVTFVTAPAGYGFGAHNYDLFVANYTSGAIEAWNSTELGAYISDLFDAGGSNAGIAAVTSSGVASLWAGQTERLGAINSVTYTPPCCSTYSC
jgi:hypothetical protein